MGRACWCACPAIFAAALRVVAGVELPALATVLPATAGGAPPVVAGVGELLPLLEGVGLALLVGDADDEGDGDGDGVGLGDPEAVGVGDGPDVVVDVGLVWLELHARGLAPGAPELVLIGPLADPVWE